MEAPLKGFLADLKEFRRIVKAETHERVAKKSIRLRAEQLSTTWFDDIAKGLADNYGFAPKLIERYSDASTRLIKLTEHNNLKKSYLETLDALIRGFRDELILPLQRKDVQLADRSLFGQFVASLANPEENAYFQEAIDCAQKGFLRAATVMGWCAAIDRSNSSPPHAAVGTSEGAGSPLRWRRTASVR